MTVSETDTEKKRESVTETEVASHTKGREHALVVKEIGTGQMSGDTEAADQEAVVKVKSPTTNGTRGIIAVAASTIDRRERGARTNSEAATQTATRAA